ncbi:beta-ketoacyl synthase N-terminal-like domain-containing protein [Bacillus thuringiensis]|uniref:beta-ketoacyl synthase N-terminal-like domain-containing protein n=1 Tax=Bacillus thuringiensis TaxID=1428 RepID=UPI000CD8886E|nr:beta-ketoacyl synthase N-terminal-like domain-containing protein [Bacillus thuringiensis]QFQ28657.1 polyketide beta-ketoacyl:ACP synthase [Bacillus thuringiensis]
MKSIPPINLHISGIGVTSAIGQGQEAFSTAMLEGRSTFDVMKRPGRQRGTSFIGAEIASLSFPERIGKKVLRSTSWSGQVALATLYEAWQDASLDEINPRRIGLIIGGTNVQQRELVTTFESYVDNVPFIRPSYALSFMDSDLCGLCTEQFGIQGFAYTLGGASASGQLAIIQAAETVLSGRVDVCIAVGALMDLSYLECQSFHALGAMGSDRFADIPAKACRPFDRDRDGFIYGENCAALVVERAGLTSRRDRKSYAEILGWSVSADANRNPNPSCEGEMRVIRETLDRAGLAPEDIDYINPHGSGSVIGDETELKALYDSGLKHAYINSTKSITGHGLSAAGAVEVAATVLQMKAGRLHPSLNLENPISPHFQWGLKQPVKHRIEHALSLSIGFGGINTALCLRNLINS